MEQHETSIRAALAQLKTGQCDDDTNLDILTEAEKQEAIEWAIKQEKIAYRRKMGDLLVDEKIFDLITPEQWLQKINPQQVLKSAAIRKQAAIDTETERKRQEGLRKEQQTAFIASYTAETFFKIMRRHFLDKHGRFIYEDWNKQMVKAVCYYMSNDPRFETELNFSFNKGLMILGQSGLGKTELFKAVSINPLKPIYINSILRISEVVKDRGYCDLNERLHLLIDDVGSEQETVNHYGTKIQWFKEFIENYYLHNRVFNRLIITSNLSGQEIENRYGYRVRSRLREMMNIVTIQGEDLRG